MGRTAQDYLDVWRKWIGYSEKNGKYREIIDLYNSRKPLPRGYRVGYGDAWCDVTVSAAAVRAGMEDLTGRECSCEEHIRIFKEKGIWTEDGSILPEPGYLIVYNWNDGNQPNDGAADHIGVVEEVRGRTICCIEGNYRDSVARREIPVGWGYIRGYAMPDYDKEAPESSETGKSEEHTEDKNGTGGKSEKTLELNKAGRWTGIVEVSSSLNVRRWAGTEYAVCSFSPLTGGSEVEVCDSIKSEDGELWYYIKYQEKWC